jgi:hypothetical protein
VPSFLVTANFTVAESVALCSIAVAPFKGAPFASLAMPVICCACKAEKLVKSSKKIRGFMIYNFNFCCWPVYVSGILPQDYSTKKWFYSARQQTAG